MQQNKRVPHEKIQTSYFLNHPTSYYFKGTLHPRRSWSRFSWT